jgi:acyl carrier protein
MQQNLTLDKNPVDAFKSWLTDWMVRELGIDRSKIDPSHAFLSYGMDSVQAMTMVGDIEAMMGLRLNPTLAWDYPDINALSAYLVSRTSAAPSDASVPATSVAEIENLLAGFDTLSDRDVESLLNQYVDKTH